MSPSMLSRFFAAFLSPLARPSHFVSRAPRSRLRQPCGLGSAGEPSMALLLARHGERLDYIDPSWLPANLRAKPWDPPLSEDGKRQAEALASGVAAWCDKLSLELAAVYSSPFIRAKQTAEPTAAKAGLQVKVEPGLVEWVGEGFYTAWACPDSNGRWASGQQAPRPELNAALGQPIATLLGLEPPLDASESHLGCTWGRFEDATMMTERMAACADRLAALHPGRAILLVGHAGPVSAAAQYLSGAKDPQPWLADYASLFVLARRGGEWEMLAANDTQHLT
eukprot:gnl/TRDRNA2_/TRDRNA2_29633_c0_seq1.p1 gnl/TRDRNA2_/TRDRNA2_29633_c0~~gnl/TRDRNA2_/TRDRNA2_29633_c0_seq1.p1  ORF type:complete len:281 (+),score=30.46 gnl/TRDRNA2_/TRDRNA2_29633_c0_seq1:67-909(+)